MHNITRVFYQSMCFLSVVSFGILSAQPIQLSSDSGIVAEQGKRGGGKGQGGQGQRHSGGHSGGGHHKGQGGGQGHHKGQGDGHGQNHGNQKHHGNNNRHWDGRGWSGGYGGYGGGVYNAYPVYPVGGDAYYDDSYNSQYYSGDSYYDGSQQQPYNQQIPSNTQYNPQQSPQQSYINPDLPDDMQIQVSGASMKTHQVAISYTDGTSDSITVTPNQLNSLVTIPYNETESIYIVVGDHSQIPTMTPENNSRGNWKWITPNQVTQGYWLWISY